MSEEQVALEVTSNNTEDVKQTVDEVSHDTATVAQDEVKQEEQKVFTQAELNAVVQKRVLKAERNVQRRIEQQLKDQHTAQILANEPKRELYGDDDSYWSAQVEHLAEKKATEKILERDRLAQLEKQAETFLEKAERVSEKYRDFQSVVSNPNLRINSEMAEYISDSDFGPELAYHLGKNEDLAEQISQMSPVKAAKALIKLEQELVSKPDAKIKTTNAPDPIKPIGASKGSTKTPDQMTDREFADWRRAQIKTRT